MSDVPSKRSIREPRDFTKADIAEVSSKLIKRHKREIFVKSAKRLPGPVKPPQK